MSKIPVPFWQFFLLFSTLLFLFTSCLKVKFVLLVNRASLEQAVNNLEQLAGWDLT